MKNVKTVFMILITFLTSVCFINAVYAQAAMPASATFIEQNYASVTHYVTFNYTEVPGAPPLTKTIQNTYSLNTAGQSSNARNPYIDTFVQNIYTTNALSVITRYGVSNEKVHLAYGNLTDNAFSMFSYYDDVNRTAINEEPFTGQLLYKILPDSASVAADWCRKNNMIMGSVIKQDFEMQQHAKVKGIAMGTLNPTATDTNLDDGWSGIDEIIAGIDPGTAFLIGVGIVILVWIILDLIFPDDPKTIITNIDNSIEFTPITNITITFPDEEAFFNSTYDTYLDLCNQSGTEPTVEGFLNFYTTIQAAKPKYNASVSVTYGMKVNQSNPVSIDAASSGSIFMTLIETVVGVVILVVIIIVIVLALVMILRIIKWGKFGGSSNSSGGGAPIIVQT